MTTQCHKLGGLARFICAVIAGCMTAGVARAQSDAYDSSSRAQIHFGSAHDASTANQDSATVANPSDNSTWQPASTSGSHWQPRRTSVAPPRSGSRQSQTTNSAEQNPFDDAQANRPVDAATFNRTAEQATTSSSTESGPTLATANSSAGGASSSNPRTSDKPSSTRFQTSDDGTANNAADNRLPPRTASRRATRGDVLRSSYSGPSNPPPANASENNDSNSYQPLYGGRVRHQPGIMDNVTRQFSPRDTFDNSYGSSYGYRPRSTRLAMADQSAAPRSSGNPMGESVMRGGEEVPHGATMPMMPGDMPPPEGQWSEGEGPMPGGGESCGSGGCGGCGSCCCRPICCLFCCDWWDQWAQDMSIFAGTQAFKGPVDQGFNGDFGFHEGINWGSPLWDAMGLGAQIGAAVTESDLSRTNATDQHRNQYFFTAGLFHRPECGCGWQGGLVWDYLSDQFVDDFTVSQLRGDLSYVFNCHEVGFWFTTGVSDKKLFSTTDTTETTIRYKPIDLYAFYYGHHFANGGEGRIWGGFTGGTGGLVGADFSVPVCDKVSLESGFNYAIPHRVGDGDVPPESWSLTINLVWHPFSCAHASYCS
ncbi:MAG TPA: DUF6666 family protein, partial [Pirellulales bacterium]